MGCGVGRGKCSHNSCTVSTWVGGGVEKEEMLQQKLHCDHLALVGAACRVEWEKRPHVMFSCASDLAVMQAAVRQVCNGVVCIALPAGAFMHSRIGAVGASSCVLN